MKRHRLAIAVASAVVLAAVTAAAVWYMRVTAPATESQPTSSDPLSAPLSVAKRDGVTVVILNYKRPQNVAKSLPVLLSYPEVHRIVVLHGARDPQDPASRLTTTDGRIVHRNDAENNDEMGAGRRWLVDLNLIPTSQVVFLDDDLLPSSELITAMSRAQRSTGAGICGPIRRWCNAASGYSANAPTGSKAPPNAILTGLMLTTTGTLAAFQRVFEAQYAPMLRARRGNGDDLVYNHFVGEVLGLPMITVSDERFANVDGTFTRRARLAATLPPTGSYLILDEDAGYHAAKEHYRERSAICRALFPSEPRARVRRP